MKIYAVIATVMLLSAAAAIAQNTFRLMPESGGAFSSHARLAPTFVDARVLAANVNEDHTVPAGVKWVVFSATCAAYYGKRGGTAAVPAADVTDGTASELNPAAWQIDGVTTIGLIAPGACTLTLSFYK